MGDTYPKFKAAVAQVSPVFLNREATVEKACGLMMEAARNGAKLIAFPETYIPGYPHWIWLDAPTANNHFFKKLFEESIAIPSPATEELCFGAKEADIYVVIGINEKLANQMGTMWNTNLIIDNSGKILGKHRKIVPTFAEKMVWSRGDGSTLRVWETDLGRLGTLACGNNTHSLYRYALIAQGEQIHIANYPAFLQEPDIDLPLWNRIRTGSHSLEGKLFNLCSTSTVSSEIIDMLCGGDEEKKRIMENHRSYSCITNPIGLTLEELLDEEGILYADIDISEMITAKQFHDIVGHYTRMDVVSMNLCTQEDRPLWYDKNAEAQVDESDITFNFNLLKDVLQGQREIVEELRRLVTLISEKLSGGK
ncbi:MAG: carbon-nitrogen hydrolase family protein [Thermodesulfobacteriota bacterium]